MRVSGLGEGRHNHRKGVGAKALLAKAEGVLKLLWSWIRGRKGRKLHFYLHLCLQSPDRQKDCFSTRESAKSEAGAATGTWLSQHQSCAKVDAEPSSTSKLPNKRAGCSPAALSVFISSDIRCLTELSPSCPASVSSTDGTFHRDVVSCAGWVTLQRILISEAVPDTTVWECSRTLQQLCPYHRPWAKKSVSVGAKV